jgi:hypothetical protein
MQCAYQRHRVWFRGLGVIAVMTFASAAAGCQSWHRQPPSDPVTLAAKVPGRTVRFTTATGPVILAVRGVDFPYVTGVPQLGDGQVEFDVRTARRADVMVGTTLWNSIPTTEAFLTSRPAWGATVRFTTDLGVVELIVDKVQYPYAVGRPRESQGLVRLDLERVERVEFRETDSLKTLALTAGVLGGSVLIAALLIDFTPDYSSSECGCPFVFLNRGQGDELIGKAYTGAAFRAMQRDDLLPLPALTSRRVHVRLANEAAETQHTDSAEIVLVDHAPNVRALSTFDGHPILVGASTSPLSARDVQGRDVSALVSTRDGRIWETDLLSAARAEGEPLPDQMELTFPLPALGDPVVEFVGGNTPWLDHVAGRVVAAAGDELDRYAPLLNSPMAGPVIKAWLDSEGVNLTIEVFDKGTWSRVATVAPVDAATLREIAIPLTLSSPPDPSDVKIRLRGGLGFWRVERVALSSRVDAPLDVHRVRPTSARGTDKRDELPAIAGVDGQYSVLANADEALDLTFDLPPLVAGRTRTGFFFTNGYYEIHQAANGQSSRETVAILDKPGGLSWLSRDFARDVLHITRPSPVR